jgi:putative ABC transport system substrate-binding protein
MSYGESARDFNRCAAFFVDKIMRGAKPADLPVQAPTKYGLAINLKTAKASASPSRKRCWRPQMR